MDHLRSSGAAMNDISEILSIQAVDADLAAANKKGLFQQIAIAAGRLTGLAPKAIVASLNQREKLGSTGFGNGSAIPHGKIEGLERVFGYFARLANPIDFNAVDGMPVDLVFLLLSPPDAGADHLKALAGVSRTFRDRQVLAKLRGARSKDALYALLAGEEALNAA
jgi:PTS system nitrogen regulatory IIA component